MLNNQIYCKNYLMISLVLMRCSVSEPIKIFNIYKDIWVVICSLLYAKRSRMK